MTAGTTETGSVRSRDGTEIAYERHGDGPPIVCVGGALQHRAIDASSRQLAALLAPQFAVYLYDRRGRGESGDAGAASAAARGRDGRWGAAPHAVERELEDLGAVIVEAGGVACVYGLSSGAALAFEAAVAGVPIERLALYEPPYVLDGERPRGAADRFGRYSELVTSGRRDEAVELFVRDAGIPAALAVQLHQAPIWPSLMHVAHTLPYDMAVMGEGTVPLRRAARVAVPALVMHGADGCPGMAAASRALAGAIPRARHRTLADQTHEVAPAALAPELADFFAPTN